MLIYINRISSYLDKKSRITVVESLVLSHISYCLIIWGTTNSSLISNVQKLQNFAAKAAVGGIKKSDHVSPAYKELKWLKIQQNIHMTSVAQCLKLSLLCILIGYIDSWLFMTVLQMSQDNRTILWSLDQTLTLVPGHLQSLGQSCETPCQSILPPLLPMPVLSLN